MTVTDQEHLICNELFSDEARAIFNSYHPTFSQFRGTGSDFHCNIYLKLNSPTKPNEILSIELIITIEVLNDYFAKNHLIHKKEEIQNNFISFLKRKLSETIYNNTPKHEDQKTNSWIFTTTEYS